MLALLLLLVSFTSPADAKWIEIEDLSIDYTYTFPGGRTPLISNNGIPNKEPANCVGLNLTLALPLSLYWANRVESWADRDKIVGDGQFRTVSWAPEFGLRLIPQVDLYYRHKSEHVLDSSGKIPYPITDGVGFRLMIVGPK